MKAPSIGTLAFGAVGFTAIALIAIGAPHDRPPPTPIESRSPPPAPSSASAGGFTLVSQSVDLPDEDATYPDGPHADVINANCTSCHSASMALTQPVLSEDQWKATVAKMRDTYHAPVPASAVADIIAYLTAMPSQKVGQSNGASKSPGEPMTEDKSGGTG